MVQERLKKEMGKLFPGLSIVSVKRFSKGIMNKTFDVRLSDGKNVIFRYYPGEKWKPEKEEYVYGLVRKKTTVPVPKFLGRGNHFSVLGKVEGKELDLRDKKLVKEAGRILGKLHSITFPKFGWIVGKEIKPKFSKWTDFLLFDTKEKLGKLPKSSTNSKIGGAIYSILQDHMPLLSITDKPRLLHKDYHSSHIITSAKINGIIDFEWAMAGHSEMDLAKASLWMFKGVPQLEKLFLDGYKSVRKLSHDYGHRKRLYMILTSLSSLSISHACGNRKWCVHNKKELMGMIQHEYNEKRG